MSFRSLLLRLAASLGVAACLLVPATAWCGDGNAKVKVKVNDKDNDKDKVKNSKGNERARAIAEIIATETGGQSAQYQSYAASLEDSLARFTPAQLARILDGG